MTECLDTNDYSQRMVSAGILERTGKGKLKSVLKVHVDCERDLKRISGSLDSLEFLQRVHQAAEACFLSGSVVLNA